MEVPRRWKPLAGGQRSERLVAGGPDARKFEKEISDINKTIKELESKSKPVSSNAAQLIHAELTKETAALAELEKEKEAVTLELKATNSKISEIGTKCKEKKILVSDLLAGVRHKTDSHHNDAMERLEHQILIRRCSSSEERKFRHEIDALKKSKERLAEYLAAKSEVDQLKEQQEALRAQRDVLHKKTKEVRGKELVTRDKIVHLKQEMEEARERKKVGIAEREQLAKEIDSLTKRRRELLDRFRTEQLAFSEKLQQQSEVERQRRDESRLAREARRRSNKYRDAGLAFQRQQRLLDHVTTCKTLISHLNKLSLTSVSPLATTSAHAAATATPDLDEDPSSSSPVGSLTNLDPSPPPRRSESDPLSESPAGGYILRREEEVLVAPARVMLARKRSKKEKRRNVGVVKRLNLNPTLFSQFASLDLSPPNTISDVPQVLSLLQDKLVYLEGMTKSNSALLELEMAADSGVVSTTPSEMNDFTGDRDADFALSSQEDDPGLGASTVSPKRSHSDVPANGYSKLLSSTTAVTGASSVASGGHAHAAATTTPTKGGEGESQSPTTNLTAVAGGDAPTAANGVKN